MLEKETQAIPTAYNFLKEMHPRFGFYAAYLSCLFTTGDQAYVGLFGGKRRLSLDEAV